MRADRLLSLVLILQSRGGMTAQELAGQLEVSERTIYRDVEALSFAGIPVYTHPGVSGGIFLDENYRVSLASLTPAETQALVIASRSGPLTDLGLEKAAAGLLFKLLAALPAAQRDAADRLRERILIDPEGWFQTSEPVPFLSPLQQAVWEERVIDLAYQRPDAPASQRRLHPYALVAKANVWYLVGRQEDGQMRTFRVARIRDMTLCEARFQRATDFRLVEYWSSQAAEFKKSFAPDQPVEVVVRVQPDAVRSLVSDLSGQYERLEQADPQGWVHLRIKFPSPEAAEMRILSFSSHIEALRPAWLREGLLQHIEEISRIYHASGFTEKVDQ